MFIIQPAVEAGYPSGGVPMALYSMPIRASAAKVALEIILDASLRLDYAPSDMNLSIREDIDEMDGLLLSGDCNTEYGQHMIDFWMGQLCVTTAHRSS